MYKIEKIMRQRMSRKEFLSYIGLAIITIIGIPALFSALTKNQDSKSLDGYGSGPYGL
jgi:hypothetical protein